MNICPVDPTPPTPITLGNQFIMFRYETLPPGSLPEFCLSDYHVLAVVDMDSVAVVEEKIGDTPYPPQLKGYGSITLVPAGVSHQVSWQQSIGLTTYYLHTSLVNQVLREDIQDSQPILVPRRQTKDPSLYHLTEALKTSLLDNPRESSASLYNQSLINALVWRLVTHHSIYHLPPPIKPGQLEPATLKPVLEYINTYLEADIQLSHLAGLVNLDEAELCRSFELTMGLKLPQYLQQQRLQRIQRLLRPMAWDNSTNFVPTATSIAAAHAIGSLDPALSWVNSIIQRETGRSLTDTQTRILTGVLKRQHYSQIAAQHRQSEGHLKTVAAELWQLLSQAIGQPIRKSNLRSYLQRQGLLRD